MRLVLDILQWGNTRWFGLTPEAQFNQPSRNIADTITQLRQLQQTIALPPDSIREMIAEGRRY